MDGHGLEETEYVFLAPNRVRQRLALGESLRVGETGFGTGLNFLALWRAWKEGGGRGEILFVSTEKHLLDRATLERALAPWPQLRAEAQELITAWPPAFPGQHLLDFENGRVRLLLLLGDATTSLSRCEVPIDAWFLDGFAPSKNPDLWSEALFAQLARLSVPGATLGTYTAAGPVRRGLAAAGFEVVKSKGFAHKRHRVTAVFRGPSPDLLRSLPSWAAYPPLQPPRRVAVIGAGIAGCSAAWAFGRRGCAVTVFDPAGIAAAASGNPRGMLAPQLTRQGSAQDSLSGIGALFTLRLARQLGLRVDLGLIEIAEDAADAERQHSASGRLGGGHCESRELPAPWRAEHGAAFLPWAAALRPPVLCQALFESSGALLARERVESLEEAGGPWVLRGEAAKELGDFDAVIVCAALDAAAFLPDFASWLRPVRGQICLVPASVLPPLPAAGINFGEYLVPCEEGDSMVLGASFKMGDRSVEFRPEESAALLSSLQRILPGSDFGGLDPASLPARVALRCASPDQIPWIGPVPEVASFRRDYASLRQNARRQDLPPPQMRPGLWLSLAHGSRGLATAPLAAAEIASLACDGFSLMSEDLRAAVHPCRLLARAIKRGG
ncbi:MAG: 5-methylaminomethyl-2-thiouridine methyltransferase [Verrucomicrobiota bacterium]